MLGTFFEVPITTSDERAVAYAPRENAPGVLGVHYVTLVGKRVMRAGEVVGRGVPPVRHDLYEWVIYWRLPGWEAQEHLGVMSITRAGPHAEAFFGLIKIAEGYHG